MSYRCGQCGTIIEKAAGSRTNIHTGEVQMLCESCVPPPKYFRRQAQAKAMTFGCGAIAVIAPVLLLILLARSCLS